MTGVVLLKLLNSAHLALEEGVGSKTHIDPGGRARRLKADALSIANHVGLIYWAKRVRHGVFGGFAIKQTLSRSSHNEL